MRYSTAWRLRVPRQNLSHTRLSLVDALTLKFGRSVLTATRHGGTRSPLAASVPTATVAALQLHLAVRSCLLGANVWVLRAATLRGGGKAA